MEKIAEFSVGTNVSLSSNMACVTLQINKYGIKITQIKYDLQCTKLCQCVGLKQHHR